LNGQVLVVPKCPHQCGNAPQKYDLSRMVKILFNVMSVKMEKKCAATLALQIVALVVVLFLLLIIIIRIFIYCC
ncbi:hypothetical protein KIL84_002016, partial [Mauremys mutica]